MTREELIEYKKRLTLLSDHEKTLRDLELRKIALGEIEGSKTGYPSIDKPHLKYYEEKIIKMDIPKMNAYSYMRSRNLYNTDTAISYAFAKINYQKMFKDIEKVADSLYSLGIRKGDIITSLLPNIPEAIYIIYGAAKIGAIIDLVDPLSSKELLKKYFENSKPRLLFILDIMSENSIAIQKECNIERIITVSPVQSVPVLNIGAKLKNNTNNANVMTWDKFIKSGKNIGNELVPYEENMPLAILHTGGTTGVPKGALLSHDNINSLAHQFINSPLDMKVKEKALNLMPPFASYGLGNGIHVHLCAGINLILIPSYDPSLIDIQILKYKPNRIACSPAHYEYIKNSPKLQNIDLSFLKHPIEGGDSLDVKTENAVNKLFKKNGCKDKIVKAYGLTETCSGICACVNNEVNKLRSVGIPMVKNIISVFDLNDYDQELPYNTEGEIAVLSPNNMLGYYNNEEETNNTLRKHSDGNIWLHTGDLGYIDEDGNVFIEGRLRRMIIQFCGLKSNPFEAEEILMKHPLVKRAIVVGAKDPDHEQGELPVAYILVDEKVDEEQLTKELHKLCEDNITYYSVPVDFLYVKEYPRTSIAKVDFKKMSQEYNDIAHTRKMIPQKQLKI